MSVSQVEVTPEGVTVDEGDMGEVSLRVTASDGSRLQREGAWRISGPSVVELMGSGATRRVKGVQPGSTVVVVTVDGMADSATVQVRGKPQNVDAVDLSSSSLSLEAGTAREISAEVTGPDGSSVDKPTHWKVGDESVVRLSGSGNTRQVEGLVSGSTRIVVKAGGVADTASVEVTAPEPTVESVDLSPSSVSMEEGASWGIDLAVSTSDGSTVDRSGTWQVGDASVVDLSGSGSSRTVEALSAGTTVVIAAVDGAADTASIEVTSSEPTVASVEVSPQSYSIEVDTGVQLSATVTDDSGDELDRTVSWTSSSSSVATVDSGGVVTGQAEGTAEITAAVDGVADTAVIDVTASEPTVSSVDLSPSSLSLEEGSTADVSLDVTASDGTTMDVSGTWQVGDTSVASLSGSGSSRTVEALSAGTTVVIASVDGVADTASVEVTTPPDPEQVSDLTVSAATDSSVRLAWTEVDDGTGDPADYAVRYGSPTMDSWTNAYPTEETVQGDGIGTEATIEFTGMEPATDYEFRVAAYRGTLDVDATFGPLSNPVNTTTDPESTSGSSSLALVSGDGQTGTVGETLSDSLVVEVTDDAGSAVSDETVSWSVISGGGSVSASSVGTDADGRARVDWTLGGSTGTQEVRAEIGSGDAVTFSATAEAGSVATVQVSPSSADVTAGDSVQLDATLEDAYGNEVDGSVTWSSTNTTVAEVDGSGLVQANSAGDATITAAASGVEGAAAVEVVESGSSSAYPHDPEGFSLISERGFGARNEGDWNDPDSSNEYFDLVEDAGAPRSPSSVARVTYPTDIGTGTFIPSVSSLSGWETSEVYVSYWLKLSENWEVRDHWGMKLGFILDSSTGGAASPVYLGLRKPLSADEPPAPCVTLNLQHSDLPNRNWNLKCGNGGTITRGQWHQIEVVLRMNSAVGTADGEAHMWVDGAKVVGAYDAEFSDGDLTFDWLKWEPMWGGGNSEPPSQEQYHYMDHIYVSGK